MGHSAMMARLLVSITLTTLSPFTTSPRPTYNRFAARSRTMPAGSMESIFMLPTSLAALVSMILDR